MAQHEKISCWHGIPAGTDCPGTEIIYTGRELCSPHASISSQITARFWHIIYDIYWYLHYISMIVINVYNNYVFHVKLDMISWCSVPSPAYTSCHVTITPPFRQNNVAMTFGVWLWRYCYVIYMLWYICNVLHVAPYTHNSNMPFCINNNHLNKSNLTFVHGKYIGLLAMIMLLHNTLLILCLLS